MKKLGLLVVVSVIVSSITAQTSSLILLNDAGKLYLNHTVAPKENWYSVGRIYNVSPKELASFNGLTIDKGLEIGELLNIPVSASNYVQKGSAGPNEVFVPLYHVVAEKEGLYRIGQNFNKVKVADLKAWNGLTEDEISNGQKLVVGFLRVKKDQSPLAVNGIRKIGGAVAGAANPVVENTQVPRKDERPTEIKPKIPDQVAVKTEPVDKSRDTNRSGTNALEGAGYSRAVYLQQNKNPGNIKTETGMAAIFKSTSGWQDAKYYALMNNISPGTIIRITNPGNNKSIFAKVLGELPPGKENEGLLIRISNAASAELLVSEKEPRFPVEIGYVKE